MNFLKMEGTWKSQQYPNIRGKLSSPELPDTDKFDLAVTFHYQGEFRNGEIRTIEMEFVSKTVDCTSQDGLIMKSARQLVGRTKELDVDKQFQISVTEYLNHHWTGFYSTINPVDVGSIDV